MAGKDGVSGPHVMVRPVDPAEKAMTLRPFWRTNVLAVSAARETVGALLMALASSLALRTAALVGRLRNCKPPVARGVSVSSSIASPAARVVVVVVVSPASIQRDTLSLLGGT